jgi:fermentation-respiration switch protein FrsA (DUF1100 family)
MTLLVVSLILGVSPERQDEREMTIGSSEWVLPATLTVPAGTGPWPAVVLVHGSGPNDRDETVGANKPFSAWHSGSRRAVSSCFVTTSERWFTEPGCLGGMLILHGERDYQVTAEEFARWKAALDSRPDVTFESYPAPNHLFIAGAGLACQPSTKFLAMRRRGHPRHRDVGRRVPLMDWRATACYGVLASDSVAEIRLARNAGIVADSRHTITITAVQPIMMDGSHTDTP